MSDKRETVPLETLLVLLPFLRDVPPDDLKHIFGEEFDVISKYVGDVIYEQEDDLDLIYVLIEGAVRQERIARHGDGSVTQHEREVTLKPISDDDETEQAGAILCAYDLLFFDKYSSTTTVIANRSRIGISNRCRLLVFDSTKLNRLIFRYPEVRRRLARIDLVRRLRIVPLLKGLDLAVLGMVADAVEVETYETDGEIYSGIEPSDRVYIIDRGQVMLVRENLGGRDSDQEGEAIPDEEWIANGTAFGLQEDGSRRRRSASYSEAAKAQIATQILSIEHSTFSRITSIDPDVVGADIAKNRRRNIKNLPVFARLDSSQKRQIAGFFSHYCFPSNQLLVQQGEEADSLWVMIAGSHATIQALDVNGKRLTSTISLGDTYFCETALFSGLAQESSIEAMPGSEWLRLHRDDFRRFDRKHGVSDKLVIPPEKRRSLEEEKKSKRQSWLQPGEYLILLSRRHWIAFFQRGLLGAFLLFGLLALIIWATMQESQVRIIVFPITALALGVLAVFAWVIVDYFNDWIAVTNRRVIYQETVFLNSRLRKVAPLEQIQQVTQAQGFWGKIFNYGTTLIQTASTAGRISFSYTRNFEELEPTINTQRNLRLIRSSAESKTDIARILADRLGHMLDLPIRVFAEEEKEEDKGRSLNFRFWRRKKSNDDNRIVWRKHWLALLPRLWLAILTLFFTFALTLVSALSIGIVPEPARPVGRVIEVFLFVATLIALGQVLWVYVDWWNDTYEVDDKNLTHIDQLPFQLFRTENVAPLAVIQNIETDIPTPIHWIFNYGTVHCQTAAEDGDFIFESVPMPSLVAGEIQWRMSELGRKEDARQREARAKEFPDWLEIYHKMETDDMPL